MINMVLSPIAIPCGLERRNLDAYKRTIQAKNTVEEEWLRPIAILFGFGFLAGCILLVLSLMYTDSLLELEV